MASLLEGMARRNGPTRLQQVIDLLGLKPAHIVMKADQLARTMRIPGVSRTHFGRLRSGRQKATEDKIRLLVAAFRALTGLLIRATDLFDLEPQLTPLTASALMGHADPFRGDTRFLSLFSLPRSVRAWRPLVADEDDSSRSASRTLEILYREHAPLMRSEARRLYDIPEEDAEELIHDIFASFLERQPRVDSPRAYLLASLRHAVSHYRRKRRHDVPLGTEHDQTVDVAASEREERWLLHSTMGLTLARLGEKCRETLRRFYFLGHKPDAIARELKTTPGYVFQLLHACRKRAREIYLQLTSTKR